MMAARFLQRRPTSGVGLGGSGSGVATGDEWWGDETAEEEDDKMGEDMPSEAGVAGEMENEGREGTLPTETIIVCEPIHRFRVTAVSKTFPFVAAETVEIRDEPILPRGGEMHQHAASLERQTFSTLADVVKLSRLLEARAASSSSSSSSSSSDNDDAGGGGGDANASSAEEELERVRHRLDLFRVAALDGELSPAELGSLEAADCRRQEALGFLVADLIQVGS